MNIPFVTMLTILKVEETGLLSAPWFFTHTVTVPTLYWGSPVMDTEVTNVDFLYSKPFTEVFTMYSTNDRPTSSAGTQDT